MKDLFYVKRDLNVLVSRREGGSQRSDGLSHLRREVGSRKGSGCVSVCLWMYNLLVEIQPVFQREMRDPVKAETFAGGEGSGTQEVKLDGLFSEVEDGLS